MYEYRDGHDFLADYVQTQKILNASDVQLVNFGIKSVQRLKPRAREYSNREERGQYQPEFQRQYYGIAGFLQH